MTKHGYGKLIQFNGSFKQGYWDQDKLSGKSCKIYDASTGDMYMGPIEEDKKVGRGIYYDAEQDEIYDGEFENDKRQGEGWLYRRSGEVLKGDFRNNYMEGSFKKISTFSKEQVDKFFEKCKISGSLFIAVNK